MSSQIEGPHSGIPSYEERMKWFHEARFGMFIHWGLYSLHGRGEWVMFNERIPAKQYARLARRFRGRRSPARSRLPRPRC